MPNFRKRPATIDAEQMVGLGNIKVIIVPDEKSWFAQGLEIDYGAQGDTPEDAKKNFQEGLGATIDLHLRMYGTIEKLLESAPPEVLQEASRNQERLELFSQVSFHDIGIRSHGLPFSGIDYYQIASEET